MNLTFTYPKKDDPITTSEEFYGTSSSDDNPSTGLEYMRGSDRSAVSDEDIKVVEEEYKQVNKANFDNIDTVMTAKADDEQGRIVEQQVFNKTVQLQQQPTTPEDFIERVQTDVNNTELEIEEDELLVNPTWNESGRILKTFLESTRSDKSDGEFALQLGNEMFANIGGGNVSGEGTRMTGGLLPLVTKAVNSGDENVINALLYTMEMYDRKPMTSRGWVDGIGYLLGDASNYIGLGFVANATRHTVGKSMGNTAVKGMLKEALAKIASSKVGKAVAERPVATEAVRQGALWSAIDELGKEIITARSGVRGNNEIDLTNIAGAGVAGGIAGLGLVTIPPAIWRKGSKEVREYINRSLRRESKGIKTFKRIAGEQPIIGDEAGSMAKDIKQPTGSTSLTGTFDDLVATGSLKELQAYMRHATPEERPQLIEKMKTFNKKPKSVKAKEQILVQEDFNEQFYSKLDHEVSKIADEKTFNTPTEANTYLIKLGVKPKEIEASGLLEMNSNLPDKSMNGAEIKSYLENRPDKITKRIYDDESVQSPMEFDEWESENVSVQHGVSSNSSDSGISTLVSDEYSGYEIHIEHGYNDEIYVDQYNDHIGDYNDVQEHWFENNVVESDEWYVNAKDRYNEENVDAGATWDEDLDYSEQRDFVIAEASDDAPWYEIYSNQENYDVIGMGGDSQQVFDDLDEAEKYAKEYLFEDYEYRADESGAEIYESYTVGGGENYRMNVYHMDEFEAGTKDVAREPHMGEFEYGDENVQMHTRLKEREDADGNTGIVIEEVQSQWEQDWRKTGGAKTPLTETEVKAIEAEMKPFNEEWSTQGEVIDELKRKSNVAYKKVRELRDVEKEKYSEQRADILKRVQEIEEELKPVKKIWMEETGEPYEKAKKAVNDLSVERKELIELDDKIAESIETSELVMFKEEANKLDIEANKLQTAQQEYYNRHIKPLDDKLSTEESKLATPPMQERTQYERVALLDELLQASQEGHKFFGWNNSGIQNGSRVGVDDRGREGMKNAYDLEIPRIIQKATGETPYKYYHNESMNNTGKPKEYWDLEKAKDLEYDEDITWYWRVDLDDKLTSKLNDSKIELYGIGGATLIGAGTAEQTNNEEQ